MKVLGFNISRKPKNPPAGSIGSVAVGIPGQGGYIREPYPTAWQSNQSLTTRDGLMAASVPYACTDLISSDIAKLRIKYVKLTEGVWLESPAPRFVGLIKQPNAYQTRDQFIKAWIVSKLSWGNAYIMLTRNAIGAVVSMDVLNPKYVVPLVAPDQSVYYQITMSPLQVAPLESTVVPARDIIHDRGLCPWHPLVGMSPLAACAAAVLMSTSITNNSSSFFANQARPSGILTTPNNITQEQGDKLRDQIDAKLNGTGAGKTLIMGNDMKYMGMTMASTDAQLIEQLQFSVADVCRTYHVPLHKVGADNMRTAAPTNAVFESQYYSDCLQAHIEGIECLLELGLGLPEGTGLRFDLTQLMRMDESAMITNNALSVGSGVMTPNEARALQGLTSKVGGDTPYLQVQNYALAALAARDAAGPPTNGPATATPTDTPATKPEPK
jgi:HK97 family phage portal protein